MDDRVEELRREVNSEIDGLMKELEEANKELMKLNELMASMGKELVSLKESINRVVDAFLEIRREERAYGKASREQIRYIKLLYRRLNKAPEVDLEGLSKREASQLIDRLKKELGWV